MKRSKRKRERTDEYTAPLVFVALFYLVLAAWTVASIYLLGSRYLKSGWPLGQLLMIGFVLAYTWYFSMGIAYRIRMDGMGEINLISFRRVIRVRAAEIGTVEGPRFGIPLGFVRFRLEREKGYLFSVVTDGNLQKVLLAIRRENPGVKFKYL